jgi:tRNA splicing ligase
MRERVERLRETTQTRDEFVRSLVPLYREDMCEVARICDEEVDRRGHLLGWLREANRVAS